MAEIYRDDTTKSVALGVAGASVTAVKFIKNGVVTNATPGPTAPIPYSIVHLDGEFQVEWTFTVGSDTYTRRETHNVVTPFFTASTLVASDPDFSTLSDSQVINLERMIRQVIEAYCGQKFGYREGTLDLYGNGSAVLNSPYRVISTTSVNGYSDGITYNTRAINDGYGILRGSPEYEYDSEEDMITDTVIGSHLVAETRGFKRGSRYVLQGTFGWPSVPQEVIDAALQLAQWYGCNESTWRERYIASMRSADWRVDFNSQTFSGTGSVVADQLLAKYVVNDMVVL
jgi:hypothetical protein